MGLLDPPPLKLSAVAAALANPESALNSAVAATAAGVVAATTKPVDWADARGNLSLARPNATHVIWTITTGDPNPVHVANGDAVWEVTAAAVPWTPVVLSNKVAWFDAQQLAVANGVAVASWPDLSGNANHLAQATSGFRPVMNTTKINGHPAVVADGVDDYLSGAISSPLSHPFTMYLVAGTDLADNTSGSDNLIDGTTSTATTLRAAIYRSTTEAYTINRGAAVAGSASAWTTGPKLMKAVFNGATSTLDVNGASVVSGATSTASSLMANLFLFCNGAVANFFPGYVGEVIFVSGLVSSDDHTLVYNYLNTRWGLGL